MYKRRRRSFLLAFSEDGSRAFLSATDDTGVRLASLGRASAGARDQSLRETDRAALVSSFRHRKGKLDGAPVSPRDMPTPNKASPAAEAKWPDTLEFPGDLHVNRAAALAAQSENSDPFEPIFACYPLSSAWRITAPVCARWVPEGFRDVGISSSVPSEDYNLKGPAAYANASVYDGGLLVWEGRLDRHGCSPPINYCMNRIQVDVSTASLATPTTFIGSFPIFGTREFVIEPRVTYTAGISFDDSPTGEYAAIATIRNPSYQVRVASVVSRILTMPDNGVQSILFAPPLVIRTDTGCRGYKYKDAYGVERDGEACALANTAWFGAALREQNGVYVPTGRHTTEDAYTIGHELGHSMQLAGDGGPDEWNYEQDAQTPVRCGCAHVNDGNRTHCLQSRHNQATAELEGFAHFYAA